MPIGIRPLIELPTRLKEAISNWINQGLRLNIPVTLDASGAPVESDAAGVVISEPVWAMSTSPAVLTLSVPARKITFTVRPDTAGGDAATSFWFTPNPTDVAEATIYLTSTLAGPRSSVLSNATRSFVFSKPVTSIGVVGTTALGDVEIEVTP